MNSCVVLGDATVHKILIDLSKDEILAFIDKIAASLRDFSVGPERSYQPEPAVVKRDDGRMNLFRPFTSPSGVGIKIIVDPSAALSAQKEPTGEKERVERNKLKGLHGILALCDENGFPQGFLNAEEITGYRTSLSAMLLFTGRRNTTNIVVFGAGKQALWHIRLALALRGNDINKITLVNRTEGRIQDLLSQVQAENNQRWQADARFEYKLSDDSDGLKSVLSEANVVFCTTPSRTVLFPATYLANNKQGCYVSAIGSWSSDMIELDPMLLTDAAQDNSGGSLLIVDDRDGCMKNAGEVAQSGLEAEKITEIGELLNPTGYSEQHLQPNTRKCMEEGFVVYKSIGVSLTDLSAGQALLTLARKYNQGLSVDDF